MILVTLGTQDKSFERLLKIVDDAIVKNIINEEVIVQSGCTKYTSSNMKIYDYINIDDLNKYIDDASYVITHGGVGSIFTCLDKNKKVIAIPRLAKYGEHHNDHQLDIINKFTELGYIMSFNNISELSECINKIDKFKVRKYKSNTKNMIKLIEDFINM